MDTFALKNRIAAVNTLHQWLNDTVPGIIAHIKAHPYKVNKDKTGLFKKDKEALDALIANPPFRAHYKFSEYSGLSLVADIHYPVKKIASGGEVVNYYDAVTYLDHTNMPNPKPFEPWPIYDIKDVLNQAGRLPELEAKKRAIESEINKITWITEGR